MRGLFITFEGSEGCGKSTQARLLAAYLRGKGYEVASLREPGGTGLSEKIRNLLLNPASRIGSRAETLLYMAARAQAAQEIIRPALSSGKIVISDRFLDSTLVYQGLGLGLDLRAIRSIGRFAVPGLIPHLTIVLDLPVERGLRHRYLKADRIEQRSLAYHQRVRKGYLKLARLEPARIKVVRVAGDKLKTQSVIREIVNVRIAKASR